MDSESTGRFVVQIHDARRMHFDFRLEVDGVLKSWAVPRGPSDNPSDKRLAVPTDDHPLEYREFEGVIPQDEQGSGTVIVWDQGTYRPTSHDLAGAPVPFAESLETGHATFWLDGAKLHGEFALTRFHIDDEDGTRGPEAWLLIKANDRQAVHDRPGTPDPYHARSARTGRTLHQVAVAEREGAGREPAGRRAAERGWSRSPSIRPASARPGGAQPSSDSSRPAEPSAAAPDPRAARSTRTPGPHRCVRGKPGDSALRNP